MLHHCLKHCGSVGVRHYKILEVTRMSIECSFPFVSLLDANQVTDIVEVEFAITQRPTKAEAGGTYS